MIPPSWSGQSAGTGVLRTRCIGCWTSPSARMTAAFATGRLRATSLSFARSLSTWSPGTGAPKPAYVAGARRLPGTTATCSRSSHTKLMREPWGTGMPVLVRPSPNNGPDHRKEIDDAQQDEAKHATQEARCRKDYASQGGQFDSRQEQRGQEGQPA